MLYVCPLFRCCYYNGTRYWYTGSVSGHRNIIHLHADGVPVWYLPVLFQKNWAYGNWENVISKSQVRTIHVQSWVQPDRLLQSLKVSSIWSHISAPTGLMDWILWASSLLCRSAAPLLAQQMLKILHPKGEQAPDSLGKFQKAVIYPVSARICFLSMLKSLRNLIHLVSHLV